MTRPAPDAPSGGRCSPEAAAEAAPPAGARVAAAPVAEAEAAPPAGAGGSAASAKQEAVGPRTGSERWLGAALALLPAATLWAFASERFTRFHPLKLAVASVGLLAATLWFLSLPRSPAAGSAVVSRDGSARRRAPSGMAGAPSLVLLALLLWSTLSVAWSPAPGRGLLQLALWGVGAGYLWLLSAWLRREPAEAKPRARIFAGAWLAAGAAAAGLALAQRLGGWRLGVHQITGPVGNPNDLAVALVAVLPAGLVLTSAGAARCRRQRWGRGGFAAVASAAILAGLWATRCQAAWAALAAMVFAAVALRARPRINSKHRGRRGARPARSEEGEYIDVFNRRATLRAGMDRRPNAEVILGRALTTRRRWPRVVVLGAAGSAMAGALVAWGLPDAVSSSLEGRWLLARISGEVVREAPVHGTGLGGYAHAAAWAQGALLASEAGPWSPLRDAHQQGLQVLAELGLVGCGLALALLGALLWRVWRRRHRAVARAALVAWVGLAVFCLTESALQRVEVLLPALGWLALGAVGAPTQSTGARGGGATGAWIERLTRRDRARAVARAGAVALASALVVICVGQARADYLHARGLRRLASLGGAGAAGGAGGDDGAGGAGSGAGPATLRAAEQDYDAGLRSASDPAELWLARALLRRSRGRDAAARADARQAFAALPSPDRALLLGDLETARGRPQAARWWYRVAVALHPRYARAYNNLGVAHLRARDQGMGCAVLRRALSLRPFDETIRGNWQTWCEAPLGTPLAER